MQIKLAYGKEGLPLEVDRTWNAQVVQPKFLPGLPDPKIALLDALRSPIASIPLRQLASPDDRVGIIINDKTRATPTKIILEAILAELSFMRSENIIIFIALGTHQTSSLIELKELVGETIYNAYRIVQNNSFDRETQVLIGKSSFGNEIWLNRELMDCSLKILTGFIEPHLFAGFSGGGKAIMPGMAGLQTILGNHSPKNISNINAVFGVTRGNPIWEEIFEISQKTGKNFLVNVALNKHKAITGVFAGDLEHAHAQGCKFVKETAMSAVDDRFDIVVTTNSGYPLDLNLYQSVKGLSAAAPVTKKGGSIILVSECSEGIPEHGMYGSLLKRTGNPQAMLDLILQPGFQEQDMWQAQIQAQIQLGCDVYVHSRGLSDDQIRSAMLIPARSVEETINRLVGRYGTDARICILPEGPVTIPYLSKNQL